MKSTRRLGLVAMLVVLGAVLAAPAALAHKSWKSKSSYELLPPAVGSPEPNASGQWTLSTFDRQYWGQDDVDVKCRGLTPGQQYSVVVRVWCMADGWLVGMRVEYRTLVADRRGRLECQFPNVARWSSDPFAGTYWEYVGDVWVEDDQGNIVLDSLF